MNLIRCQPLSDSQILQEIQKYLAACSKSGLGTLILETAGGVHSPTPSGSSQADLYRPLRLPICLVADHHLGGISASISAFESLHVRGYDLDVAMQFEDSKYQNHSYLKEYFEKKGILTLSLPPPPARLPTEDEDFEVLSEYYEKMSAMDGVEEMIFKLTQKHVSRISAVEEMSTKAHSQIWYPFTQHTSVSPQTIIAIDSASGDFFQTHSTTSTSSLTADQKIEVQEEGVLSPTFDGSASWWTQGLGHGNPDLSLTAAYAAGRYGHVMFAGTIHEPALKLASSLLTHLQNPRLSKVFYSDNGSTGMEVATKMALTATEERYGWEKGSKEVGVLGLKGSYHGDTIGAMDCSEPSTFNERVHWYQGRGYWFDFPQVKCKDGAWVVESPEGMENQFGRIREFDSLGDIFDLQARCETAEGQRYREYIEETIERLVKVEGKRFGALIMEV
jgi:dethiobiotin synthetase/adenosylmethionine--8-amino-7-oxononanoate aminotransferase